MATQAEILLREFQQFVNTDREVIPWLKGIAAKYPPQFKELFVDPMKARHDAKVAAVHVPPTYDNTPAGSLDDLLPEEGG